jgi:hypothetical protein
MIGQLLDFDNVIKTSISFYAGCSYDKTFAVKKNGIPIDWASEGIIDIIITARTSKKNTDNKLTLKLSEGGIEIMTGFMIWHLTEDETTIEPMDYDCFEVSLIYAGNKKRIWWDAGMRVKRSA